MIIENSEALKCWLTNCLGRMCDADPAALAKYVVALVKKDKTENELREFCLDQLDVFLLKDTKTFVDLLFETLNTKSYLETSDQPVIETILTSSPSCNSTVTATTILCSSDSNLNDSVKVEEKSDSENPIKDIMTETKNISLVHKNKSEIKSTCVNLDQCKPKTLQRSSSSIKSRSGSPVRKLRPRSRSREGEDERKKCATDEDKCKRHFPSKKARIRKHSGGSDHYSKGTDEKLGIKNDKKNCKIGTDRGDQTNQEGNLDKDLLTKSRSRSNSWDKRSRSCSWSSHSSSRSSSRSRSRDRPRDVNSRSDSRNTLIKLDTLKQQVSDHGDTDYRQKLSSVSSTQPKTCNNYTSKGTKRCQDYDEKGYCMRGDLCLFDHGADPLVVEDVSVLNFGVPVSQVSSNEDTTPPAIITVSQAGSKSPLQPPPPPVSPPPLPPPPPPLPPLPPPGSYAPEPYNPEAPGMNVTPRDHINYWVPTNVNVHIPPPHHSPGPPPTSGIPSVLFNINEPPPYHNSKPQRTRELIGVPTVDDVDSSCLAVGKGANHGEKTPSIQNYGIKNFNVSLQIGDKEMASTSNEKDVKRKGFDYNRLGPNPKKLKVANRCTLEVRRVPKQLNSIAMLNNHFSKFGKIVNLQVGYDGDPEAAIVQFMNHAEASAAYKSTDAVFNNRFIKVFWHNKDDRIINVLSEEPQSTVAEVKSREQDINQATTEVDDNKNEFQKKNCDQISERAMMYVPKAVSHRTVYQPSFVRRNNMGTTSSGLTTVRRQTEDLRKDAMQKKLELHRKKQEFLESQIQHQKAFLEQLSKCKNEKEKDFLKQTLQKMTAKISELQNDVKKDSEELKNLLKTASVQMFVAKTEVGCFLAEKELLDAEMDLYNKQHKGDDTAELLSKVYELKQKAKALGALDNCSSLGQGGVSSKAGNSRFLGKGSGSTLVSSRIVDHRTRKILTSGLIAKDALLKHFQEFGDVENVEESEGGFIFTFRTRMEAEGAFTLGSKLGDEQLCLSWFNDSQVSAAENPLQKNNNFSKEDKTTDDSKDNVPVLVDEDEEDEDEDSEARSWRR